jgi:hypothetical protein
MYLDIRNKRIIERNVLVVDFFNVYIYLVMQFTNIVI